MKRAFARCFRAMVLLLPLLGSSCVDLVYEDPAVNVVETDGNDGRGKGEEDGGSPFLRSMAIGYSYNGLEGDFCNPGDVRCQVLNREEMDRLSGGQLVNYNRYSSLFSHSSARYASLTDYVHSTTFSASGGIGISVFGARIEGTYTAFEEGLTESLMLTDRIEVVCADYDIQWQDLQSWLARYPEMLTASFRHAVDNLSDIRSVDEFISLYGTHVITHARMGASLEVELQVETTRFEDSYYQNLETKLLTGLFNQHTSTALTDKELQVVENARCRLTARGGDVGKFGAALDVTSYTATGQNGGMVEEWLSSIVMDDGDLEHSNASLVDFTMVPIWEFIPDEKKAMLVRGHILGDAEVMAETYGPRNFLDASFDLQTIPDMFLHGDEMVIADGSGVVDIVAGGRYVAVVCREIVPEIYSRPVSVAYPVYEGRVELTDGICIHEGKLYRVGWLADRFMVSKEAEGVTGTTVYLTKGKLGVESYTNIHYLQAGYIPEMVLPYDLKPDGSVASEMGYGVRKHFGTFYLVDSNGEPIREEVTGAPGWYLGKDAPSGSEWYDDRKDWHLYSPAMKRENGYVYYYNPTLARPVD